ncbi:hypothetical protein JKP88DRAFT_335179 [Tribonema minus]|uniref:DH domain-containing protein n=1 Tax=Tribonema minus TaxID=303371 RepID=A0A835YJ47_9STRA|nr:hypothetical protein JKP88DRAFT_335179 [Tribonema minus]
MRLLQLAQVLDEIVNSEETYVKHLRVLMKVFVNPLRAWLNDGKDKQPITAEVSLTTSNNHRRLTFLHVISNFNISCNFTTCSGDLARIFSNLEQLLAFNEQFLQSLQAEHAQKKRLGIVFKESASFFKMYSMYIVNYDEAMKRVRLLEGSGEFRAFVRACELQEACRGLDLRSYLIQPVQRVPRYKLLLAELLKHTKETHPDYANISMALSEITVVATRLNENARDHDRRQKVLDVQEQFKENFVTASRYLVKEGSLRKVCNGGPRKYKFVLFNDMVLYGTETLRGMLLDKTRQRYKAHKKIPLDECMVLDYDSDVGFVLVNHAGKSFIVLADTARAKQEWLDAFSECFASLSRGNEAAMRRNSEEGGHRLLSASLSSPDAHQRRSAEHALRALSSSSQAATAPSTPMAALPESAESAADTDAPAVTAAAAAATLASPGSSQSPLPAASAAAAAAATPQRQRKTSLEGPGGGGAGAGGSPRPPALTRRSSYAAAQTVQVWVPDDAGRTTEMHEISLSGLPEGSLRYGVFSVRSEPSAAATGAAAAGAADAAAAAQQQQRARPPPSPVRGTSPGGSRIRGSSASPPPRAADHQRNSSQRASLGGGGSSAVDSGGGSGSRHSLALSPLLLPALDGTAARSPSPIRGRASADGAPLRADAGGFAAAAAAAALTAAAAGGDGGAAAARRHKGGGGGSGVPTESATPGSSSSAQHVSSNDESAAAAASPQGFRSPASPDDSDDEVQLAARGGGGGGSGAKHTSWRVVAQRQGEVTKLRAMFEKPRAPAPGPPDPCELQHVRARLRSVTDGSSAPPSPVVSAGRRQSAAPPSAAAADSDPDSPERCHSASEWASPPHRSALCAGTGGSTTALPDTPTLGGGDRGRRHPRRASAVPIGAAELPHSPKLSSRHTRSFNRSGRLLPSKGGGSLASTSTSDAPDASTRGLRRSPAAEDERALSSEDGPTTELFSPDDNQGISVSDSEGIDASMRRRGAASPPARRRSSSSGAHRRSSAAAVAPSASSSRSSSMSDLLNESLGGASRRGGGGGSGRASPTGGGAHRAAHERRDTSARALFQAWRSGGAPPPARKSLGTVEAPRAEVRLALRGDAAAAPALLAEAHGRVIVRLPPHLVAPPPPPPPPQLRRVGGHGGGGEASAAAATAAASAAAAAPLRPCSADGLEAGDVLAEVDGRRVHCVAEALMLIDARRGAPEGVPVLVLRAPPPRRRESQTNTPEDSDCDL